MAQAPRHLVLLEGATGTWCTYCPGSAMAAQELIDNADPVAIVKYHDIGSDPFIIPAGQARVNYYGINNFPTSYFDGQNPHIGGSSTTSVYSSYLPLVNSAINEPTPFDISVTWTQNGNSVDISVDVEQMGAYIGGNPVVHIAATESNIQYNWLNQTEVNHALRAMVPNENGTLLAISMGQTVNTSLTLAIDSTWDQANMEIVAWVQEPATKVVYNATKISLLSASGAFDPGVTNISNTPTSVSCINSIAPEVLISNFGSDELASVTFEYSITNGWGAIFNRTHTWNGSLSFGSSATVNLPTLSFNPVGVNTMVVNITGATDVNGNVVTDAVAGNNSQTATWEYNRPVGNYTFNLTTDDYGYETYWQITNSQGTVVASGGNTNVGPYGGGGQVASGGDPGAYANNVSITETINLNGNECYEFLIVDDWGDGMCCSYGNGAYSLTDPNGVLLASGGQFNDTEPTDWFVGTPVVVDRDEYFEDKVKVDLYPNPSNGQFTIKMPGKMMKNAQMSVHSLDGRVIYQTPIKSLETEFEMNNLSAGTYILKITGDEKVVIKKLNIR